MMLFGGPPRSRAESEEVRIGFQMFGLALHVLSEMGAGLLAGWLIAWWTGWRWALPIGGVAGIAVGVSTLIRRAWKLNAQLDRADAVRRRGGAAPSTPAPDRAAPPDASDGGSP
jgi:hypothetical protein